jgi:hypothetical protein
LDARIYILAIAIVLIVSLGGDFYISAEASRSIDIRIMGRITTPMVDGNANASVKLVVRNNGPLPVKVTDALLTTSYGGFDLGSVDLEPFTVRGRSEETLIIRLHEDWSRVPLWEENDGATFSLEADSRVFLIGNSLEFRNIPLVAPDTQVDYGDNESVDGQPESQVKDPYLDEFAENLISGGPPKDGIPPIEEPEYITVTEADGRMNDGDVVFVLEASDPVKIFPQYVLVWHEIVNEDLAGEPISVTYCPLTGSAVGYMGLVGTEATTFGTSGKLVNSNLVMYDRETGSYWPQVLGRAITGAYKGEVLDQFPLVWTRWGNAKAEYPDALVLSDDTGFLRNYGSDPYGSYLDEDSYYYKGNPFMPVMNRDARLSPKEVVIGVKSGGSQLAILKSRVAEERVVNLVVGDTPVVAFYDEDLDAVRVFVRIIEGQVLEFASEGSGIVDDRGSTWSEVGRALGGPLEGASLVHADYFDVMWFSWVAYYPDTELYG